MSNSGGAPVSYNTSTFQAGETVFREGDRGRRAFLVKSGCIVLSREMEGTEVVLDSLGPGAVFGEIAVIAEAPRTATAVADADSELVEIDRKWLKAAMEEAHPLLKRLLEHFLERLQTTTERIEARSRAEDVRRAAHVLDLMRHARAVEEKSDTPEEIPGVNMKAFLERAKAATGLSAAELRQALDHLQEEGLIEIAPERTGRHRWERLIRFPAHGHFLEQAEKLVADWPNGPVEPPLHRDSRDVYEFAERMGSEPREIFRLLYEGQLQPELVRFFDDQLDPKATGPD
ncbi:Crp/Fnr family transcriptional regulator [Thiohalorhabdus sp. Cl-TMA]|uniref:Crp/Fnr family transcriptional regulator n=1 Tax=Thiohalorhabdus methylotrophus TaxID=3242694 RepID=A0ABV4TVS4_9GAMM